MLAILYILFFDGFFMSVHWCWSFRLLDFMCVLVAVWVAAVVLRIKDFFEFVRNRRFCSDLGASLNLFPFLFYWTDVAFS